MKSHRNASLAVLISLIMALMSLALPASAQATPASIPPVNASSGVPDQSQLDFEGLYQELAQSGLPSRTAEQEGQTVEIYTYQGMDFVFPVKPSSGRTKRFAVGRTLNGTPWIRLAHVEQGMIAGGAAGYIGASCVNPIGPVTCPTVAALVGMAGAYIASKGVCAGNLLVYIGPYAPVCEGRGSSYARWR